MPGDARIDHASGGDIGRQGEGEIAGPCGSALFCQQAERFVDASVEMARLRRVAQSAKKAAGRIASSRFAGSVVPELSWIIAVILGLIGLSTLKLR